MDQERHEAERIAAEEKEEERKQLQIKELAELEAKLEAEKESARIEYEKHALNEKDAEIKNLASGNVQVEDLLQEIQLFLENVQEKSNRRNELEQEVL